MAAVGMMAGAAHAVRTTTLSVTADVSPSAVFGVEFAAQPIVITNADVERGYVDVVMKSRMQLRMPAARNRAVPAVTVDVTAREDLFKSVNLAAQPRPGNGHGAVAGKAAAAEAGAVQTAEFLYRFELSDRARVGAYATSVSLAIDL